MTLEQLVTDLATSQQLKDAGFPQDTALQWYPTLADDGESEGGGGVVWPSDLLSKDAICAAPTAEEILKELPLFLNKAINEQLCVTREENTPACNGWLVGWWSMDIHGVLGGIGERSLSNVAAKSYLWWKKEVVG